MLVIVGIMVKNDEDSRGNLKQKSKEVPSFPLEKDVLRTFKLHLQTCCVSPEQQQRQPEQTVGSTSTKLPYPQT